MHQVVTVDALSGDDSLPKSVAVRPAPTTRKARWILYAMLLLALALTAHELATDAKFLRQQHAIISHMALRNLMPVYSHDTDGSIDDYECVSWRQTGSCSADGPREPDKDKPCNATVTPHTSGYCEIKHKTTGEIRRVLVLECSTARVEIKCDSFLSLASYGPNALTYTHDPTFSYDANRQQLIEANSLVKPAIAKYVEYLNTTEDAYFSKGIVMVIYEKMLPSAYASIVNMRSMGCKLPVEIFYSSSEVKPSHPILKRLVEHHDVYLREIKDPEATGFYTKLYSIFYSAFDQVLFMDADNYATKDPTYLFFTDEYKSTGAMFWPDFWHPVNTIFVVHRHSIVWQIFDVPFVDMFEQESGQILINRRAHMKAMNVLMYYGFTLPRIHQDMKMVWGDKDLFRLAWMKTKSSFHMITRPPGEAGMLNTENNRFCGVTMAQHDPFNELIFLHRNWEKLTEDNLHVAWTHVQQFKLGSPINDYRIRSSHVVKELDRGCWGADENWDKLYTVKPLSDFQFHDIETTLLRLVKDGLAIAKSSDTTA